MDPEQWTEQLNEMLMTSKQPTGEDMATSYITEGQSQTMTEEGVTSVASQQYEENIGVDQNGSEDNAHTEAQSDEALQYNQSVLPPELLKTEEEPLQVSGGTDVETGAEHIFYSDGIPQNLGQGEKLYAVVDGVAYEIITGPDNGLIARPAPAGAFEGVVGQTDGVPEMAEQDVGGGGISLEDLATISAQQETLRFGEGEIQVAGEGNIGEENLQYIEAQQDPSTLESGDMQMTMMPDDGHVMAPVTESSTWQQETIKVGGQDFVLQPGQQLPPELQDMVARGLPIDFSNYEFVIEDESGETQYVSGESTGLEFAAGGGHTQVGVEPSPQVVNPNDVLSMLAEASSAVAKQEHQEPAYLPRATSVVPNTPQRVGPIVENQLKPTAAAARQQSAALAAQKLALMFVQDENYDGEFNHVMTTSDQFTEELCGYPPSQIGLPANGYLSSYLSFAKSNKLEMSSGGTNNGAGRKPSLPGYVREFVKTPNPVSLYTPRSSAATSSPRGGVPRGRPPKPKQTTTFVNPQTGSLSSALNVPGVVYSDTGKQMSVTQYNVQQGRGKSIPTSVDRLSSPEKEGRNIQRKRKGSDTDSDGELDLEDMVGVVGPGESIIRQPLVTFGTASAGQRISNNALNTKHSGTSPRGGRGRGRPPGSGAYRGGHRPEAGVPRVTAPVAVPPPETSLVTGYVLESAQDIVKGNVPAVELAACTERQDPHNYQKGDFVVEWKDMYKTEGFSIWKIESGRLLQKFDPVGKDGSFIHKSASIYSSWTGDIRSSFKAILVDLVTTQGRRQEVVRVLDKYLPKSPDESLEQDPLMELFNVYVQSLLSEAIEPNFLVNVRTQNEEYYLGPLTQIDTLLDEAEKSAICLVSWGESFKAFVDMYPYYRFNVLATNEKPVCLASPDGKVAAVQTISMYGPGYDRDYLVTHEEQRITIDAAEMIPVGQSTVENLPTYHALHHFKYTLYKKCQQEVEYSKQNREKTGNMILEECLQNRTWVQQHLVILKDLLQKCSIVVSVVTKTEEGE